MRTATLGLLATLMVSAPAFAQDVFQGATIIDGTGKVIEDGTIVIKDGRIACVGAAGQCDEPADARMHDVSGQFITPGLVDAHVHFAQTGWLDGRPDGIEDKNVYPYLETIADLQADPGRWHRSYLCSGVTSVFDVGGAPWTVTADHATGTMWYDRANVKAAGPLITHYDLNRFFAYGALADQKTFWPMDSEEQIRTDVARIKAMGSSAIKVWFIQPTPETKQRLDTLLMVIGTAAKANGLPLIVHATELESAKTALKAGASMLVHSVDDEAIDQEFLDLLAANDAVYSPTLLAGKNWSRALLSVATGEAAEIDDPNQCVDQALLDRILSPEALQPALEQRTGGKVAPFAARFERVGQEAMIMAANLRAVHAAGGHIVMATDAGNPLTLHGPSVIWEMEAMEAAGLAPVDIIAAATLSGAKAMGIDDRTGSLEAGKDADLLVLAEDPREDISAYRALTHVMRMGVLRTQEELQVR